MGTLSSAANDRFNKIKKRGTLPAWWTLAQVGCGVLLFCFIAFRFISPSPDATEIPEASGSLGAAPIEVTETTAPEEPSESIPAVPTDPASEGAEVGDLVDDGVEDVEDADTDVDSLPAGGATELLALDGTTVSVPNAAIDVARFAVLAKFTGDYAQVPLAPGATAPGVSGTFPDAQVSEPLASVYSEGAYTISFTVDVDGTGTDMRRIGAGVILSNNEWVWSGS